MNCLRLDGMVKESSRKLSTIASTSGATATRIRNHAPSIVTTHELDGNFLMEQPDLFAQVYCDLDCHIGEGGFSDV